jgi:hypothetical protein
MITIVIRLGLGSYGKVKLARGPDKRYVALKVINKF